MWTCKFTSVQVLVRYQKKVQKDTTSGATRPWNKGARGPQQEESMELGSEVKDARH